MKKTFNDKLNDTKDFPQVKFVGYDDTMARKFGSGYMLIASPLEYNEVMKTIPEGKVVTVKEVREYLAKKHNADFTCQLTAGIFINIVANASDEREAQGNKDTVPYWRTLKKDGELNEKYPGGIDKQKMMLETEGTEVIKKGKRYFVKDYEKKLYELK